MLSTVVLLGIWNLDRQDDPYITDAWSLLMYHNHGITRKRICLGPLSITRELSACSCTWYMGQPCFDLHQGYPSSGHIAGLVLGIRVHRHDGSRDAGVHSPGSTDLLDQVSLTPVCSFHGFVHIWMSNIPSHTSHFHLSHFHPSYRPRPNAFPIRATVWFVCDQAPSLGPCNLLVSIYRPIQWPPQATIAYHIDIIYVDRNPQYQINSPYDPTLRSRASWNDQRIISEMQGAKPLGLRITIISLLPCRCQRYINTVVKTEG